MRINFYSEHYGRQYIFRDAHLYIILRKFEIWPMLTRIERKLRVEQKKTRIEAKGLKKRNTKVVKFTMKSKRLQSDH